MLLAISLLGQGTGPQFRGQTALAQPSIASARLFGPYGPYDRYVRRSLNRHGCAWNVPVLKTGHLQLIEHIREKIAIEGPVSFAWFMEQALYHPEHGYYSSGRAKLGRGGDYFTNVSVGPVFGDLVAFQFAEAWQHLGEPNDFMIVEQGAHDGTLALDILKALSTTSPECFSHACYGIVEPLPLLRQRQMDRLQSFGQRVKWVSSLSELGPFTGIHLSNELLDSMPVHLVRRGDSKDESGVSWLEKYVACDNQRFRFVELPVTEPRLQNHLQRLPSPPLGTEIEINLAALDWIEAVSERLQAGYVLTIDYGYVNECDSVETERTGTLQCRANHRLLNSPFDYIGECDITAHVNWSALAKTAQKHDLRIAGFTDQHHFLTGIVSEYPAVAAGDRAATRRQLQTLLHPEIMGRSFQVLALARGIDSGSILSGFKFARRADQQLGIAG